MGRSPRSGIRLEIHPKMPRIERLSRATRRDGNVDLAVDPTRLEEEFQAGRDRSASLFFVQSAAVGLFV